MRSLLIVVATGCVAETDVDVYAVLPTIPAACETLGAASLRIAVEPLDGPPFAVVVAPCSPSVAGQEIAGFHAQLERLTAGFHRMVATVEDADAAAIGEVALPFSPAHAVVIPFSRADLPNWPTARIELVLTGCSGDARLTATFAQAARPGIDQPVSCAAPTPLVVPRGPLELAIVAECAQATTQLQVLGDDTVELALTRTCP